MKVGKLLSIPIVGMLMTIFVHPISSGEEDFLKMGRSEGISFLSGGVGREEREILKDLGKGYSLKMVFSNRKGEYLSDVIVKILDQNKRPILTTVSNGPWLFVDLPAGIYHLDASVRGEKRISQVKVEEGSQKVIYIHW